MAFTTGHNARETRQIQYLLAAQKLIAVVIWQRSTNCRPVHFISDTSIAGRLHLTTPINARKPTKYSFEPSKHLQYKYAAVLALITQFERISRLLQRRFVKVSRKYSRLCRITNPPPTNPQDSLSVCNTERSKLIRTAYVLCANTKDCNANFAKPLSDLC